MSVYRDSEASRLRAENARLRQYIDEMRAELAPHRLREAAAEREAGRTRASRWGYMRRQTARALVAVFVVGAYFSLLVAEMTR